jgi:hypothetical protein
MPLYSRPSPCPQAGLTLPVLLKLALSLACVMAAAWCQWMEIGPYAWLAGLLAGKSGSYSATSAGAGTFIIVMLPAILVWQNDPVLRDPRWRDAAIRRMVSVVVAGSLGLAAFAWFQTGHPHPPRKATGIREAARFATFLVSDVSIATAPRPEDFGKTCEIEKKRNGRTETKTTYIPLSRSLWPQADLPVILFVEDRMDGKSDKPKFTNTVAITKKPVPYLLRKSRLLPDSVRFAVFVQDGKREMSTWWMAMGLASILAVIHIVIWRQMRPKMTKPVWIRRGI